MTTKALEAENAALVHALQETLRGVGAFDVLQTIVSQGAATHYEAAMTGAVPFTPVTLERLTEVLGWAHYEQAHRLCMAGLLTGDRHSGYRPTALGVKVARHAD